jgi:hypothetical protein
MSPAQNDYQWLQRTIASCTNEFHIQCVDVMIDLFNDKHSDFNLFSCLQDERNARWHNIENNF